MARGRQSGREKLCSKRKITSECSTQTEPLSVFFNPTVLVEKLDMNRPEFTKLPRTESLMDGNSGLSVPNSAISIQPRPSHISRTPASYKYFVKPITNNQKANSTLDNLSASADKIQDHNSDFLMRRRRESTQREINKKPAYVRPGPLSYKLRVLQDLREDMNVPVMLGYPPRVDRRTSLNLDTISEKSEENSAVPNLELNFDSDPIAKETQTGVSMNEAFCRDKANLEEQSIAVEDKTADDVPDVQKPKRINMQFKGITTIISQDSDQESYKSGSSEGNGGDSDILDLNEYKKFVKIKAHTVHIHNHFYKP